MVAEKSAHAGIFGYGIKLSRFPAGKGRKAHVLAYLNLYDSPSLVSRMIDLIPSVAKALK